MTPQEQKAAAKEFADYWKGKGYEKGQTQPFWIGLLRVLGVEHPDQGYIEFEDRAHIDSAHGFIDGSIPATRVLIEQKSLGRSLRAGIPQSDGSVLTPFQQAKRYCFDLPVSRHPRWVVTCNFEELLVHDMERPNAEPESILLASLPDELYRLSFLVATEADFIRREEEISKAAGDVVGRIYDALLRQYRDPSNPATLKSLNELCVRLVFLFYAEDAGVFRHLQFRDYLKRFAARDARRALLDLFRVLDTPPAERDPYLDPDLADFPYVNGGLFANAALEVPQLTDEILSLIVKNGSEEFDWKDISPTIFGAVFESTLNPETRRSGGMHYTSLANIHKVIGPLFLDDLARRVDAILTPMRANGAANASPEGKTKIAGALATASGKSELTKADRAALCALQDELASLTFLDPACGSGNFLTETYVCLRRLENRIIAALQDGQGQFDLEGDAVKVSIRQFHGIEINDFAVAVAKSALWIAESQMLNETQSLLHRNIDFLPLKTYDGIVEGNALRMDWSSLSPRFDYIMGNPPFVGFTFMSDEQKAEMDALFPKVKNLDYVCGWFKKAADYAKNRRTECAFVATNTITQGETAARFRERTDYKINFAHQSFVWDSESNAKAHVHCVIIGFADFYRDERWLFSGVQSKRCSNINAYLLDAPDILVKPQSMAFHHGSSMVNGNKPADGGNLIVEAEEYDDLLRREPQAKPFLRPLLGAEEYLHGKKRWCLWLDGVNPSDIKQCPLVMERIRKCKEARENSIAAGIRKFAATPALFAQRTQPVGKPFIIVPRVSSERRRYVPMGFNDGQTIVTDLIQIVPEATIYEFGVLTSNVHMAWMRAVAGRLKSDYRYSRDVVYNTFPWPEPTDEQKVRIEENAQAILNARAKFPDTCLADLYDELLMPPDLRKAHQENDRAVMAAYGFPTKTTESECVAELFKRYQSLASKGADR